MLPLSQIENPRTDYSRLSLMVLVVVGLSFMACGDDPVSSENQGDPNESLVVDGQINSYDRGEQRTWAGLGLGEGTIDADGNFSVTLHGLDEIEDRLEPVDPEGSGFDGFQGFACEQESFDAVGSEVRFALVGGFAFDNDDVTYFGLVSETVDRTLPLPLDTGTHVRWIFAEESVSINTECRDGDRTMDLDLGAGWNEVIIETERPNNDFLHEQYTGSRPGSVDWELAP